MMLSNDMLRAHKQKASTRALHILLRSRNPKVIDRTAINTSEEVFYYYNSTNNEPKEWLPGIVKAVHDHHFEISSKKKVPHTKATFEDILIKPDHPLPEALMDYPLNEDSHEGYD